MSFSSCIECFADKNVLITGGMGFIGSNLAIKLVESGANVSILDAMIDGHGGNLFNIEPVKGKLSITIGDIRDRNRVEQIVRHKDFIFHLAGQNDHVLSLANPFLDIDINIKGSAMILFACKKYNSEARLIYTGTRGEYGPADKLPVSENAPINPKGIYELSSLTAQKLFKIYHDNNNIRSITLRLTNIYGERAQMKHNRFGVVNWFIRQAIDDEMIKVFGNGSILRDFLYVEDLVNAIIMSAVCEEAYGEVFNVGGNRPVSFLELADTIVKTADTGRWEFAPFSAERAALEPGDFYSDISKIKKVIGWEPKTTLEEGLARTIDYYRKFRKYYW